MPYSPKWICADVGDDGDIGRAGDPRAPVAGCRRARFRARPPRRAGPAARDAPRRDPRNPRSRVPRCREYTIGAAVASAPAVRAGAGRDETHRRGLAVRAGDQCRGYRTQARATGHCQPAALASSGKSQPATPSPSESVSSSQQPRYGGAPRPFAPARAGPGAPRRRRAARVGASATGSSISAGNSLAALGPASCAAARRHHAAQTSAADPARAARCTAPTRSARWQ